MVCADVGWRVVRGKSVSVDDCRCSGNVCASLARLSRCISALTRRAPVADVEDLVTTRGSRCYSQKIARLVKVSDGCGAKRQR